LLKILTRCVWRKKLRVRGCWLPFSHFWLLKSALELGNFYRTTLFRSLFEVSWWEKKIICRVLIALYIGSSIHNLRAGHTYSYACLSENSDLTQKDPISRSSWGSISNADWHSTVHKLLIRGMKLFMQSLIF
jgi:hypothetical protein